MTKYVLGINSAYHEHSACLLEDGRIVAFAEEERFNRFRHGKKSRIDNSDDLPERAMAFCLQRAGIGWGDLAAVGYSFDPDRRLARVADFDDGGREIVGGFGTPEGEATFHRHNHLAREKLLERAPGAAFTFWPHHLCHASSAFHVSPFEEAAVLVVDGIGEFDSTWLGAGAGTSLREIETAGYPHSIGFVWERMSELLGFDAYGGPGKMMGYAAITDPIGELSGKDHAAAVRQIFRPDPAGTFTVDNGAFRFRTEDYRGLEALFGARRPAMVDRYEDASIASGLQTVTQEVMLHLVRRLYEHVNAGRSIPVKDLCMAGGVALNCVANYELAARGPFDRIFIQPAANDAGTALGAALLSWFDAGGGHRPRMDHPFWGPGFTDDEIRSTLERRSIQFAIPDDAAVEAARRIERGEIVAWFQGRQEVGPRALGHRSILTDPTRFDSRNRINARVKYRESFRPFAPSVLSAGMARFFELPGDLISARYMLFALPLKERRATQIIPAVIQEDTHLGVATSRVHEVDPDIDPLYAELIGELDRRVGVPVVLNTSFNIQEPIVTTPDEALDTFLRSSMDALFIGAHLVTRAGGA